MATRACKNCGSEFKSKRDTKQFCSDLCRAQHHSEDKQQPTLEEQLSALREDIVKLFDEGEKIISHFNKMREYYSDWQDRLNVIEQKIQNAEENLGLTREEIVDYNAADDAFN